MQLELLAPAKNADIGIAAIDCGADAVYIAGPSFGARAAADNAIADIARLTEYAHRFSARIYAVVNTILFDDELEQAREMMLALAEAGVDAFIIQDLGILKMDLPNVPLYASTQTVIRTPEQAARMEALGFRRLILERQMSLEEIRAIRKATSCELEFFVHGALCVSYSGQCYLSKKLSGRSANRGNCIQACRSRYDLVDADGKVLQKDRSLLSLKDYRLDGRLGDLIGAGISSFKIEGRLKNASYVKNVVRHYSDALDAFIAEHPQYSRASAGHPVGGFIPNIDATFNRGYTEAFIDGEKGKWNSVDAAKSIGEYAGKIAAISGKCIRLDGPLKISAGDGLAFLRKAGEPEGGRAESCENGLIRLKSTEGLTIGQKVYRNLNIEFERSLEHDMPRRLIDATIDCHSADGRTSFKATAQDGLCAEVCFDDDADTARNPETALAGMRSQLEKISEHYRFCVGSIDTDIVRFYPAARLNAIRRELAARLTGKALDAALGRREDACGGRSPKSIPSGIFSGHLTYLANCANRLSRQVYTECGAAAVDDAYEIAAPAPAALIRTRYCIKYELGLCPKLPVARKVREPLYLVNNGYRLKLEFDCKNCEMIVTL